VHRDLLLNLLDRYRPPDEPQRDIRDRMVAFVRANERCFDRRLPEGHVTASAWLVNAPTTHALLTHHRKLEKWLQLGGHADGETDPLQIALREIREESGLERLVPLLGGQVFDVDIHPIPAIDDVPVHAHYDVRFLVKQAGDEALRLGEESHALTWFTPAEVRRLHTDESVLRLCEKWQRSPHHRPLAAAGAAINLEA